jgi:GH24 family phage-related lysozyme (muramidase)
MNRQMTEVSRLAQQIKQLKQNRKARRGRPRTTRRAGEKTWDIKNGSWTRTMALVAIVFTGAAHWKLKQPVIKTVYPIPFVDAEQSNRAETPQEWSNDGPALPSLDQIDIDFIKRLEGFHATPYYDGTQMSWGYGTKAGRGTITREQAEEEMRAYLQQHCLPILPQGLPAHKATALASFCYNLGPDQAQQTNLWKAAHDGRGVNFLGYTRSAGGVSLLPRRRKEQSMWEGQ